MTSTQPLQVLSALSKVAAIERQLRDVKELVDRSLIAAQKYWLIAPPLIAAWLYVVSDDERFAILQGVAGQALDAFPSDEFMKLVAA
jgi:hypothetical protein